MSDGIAITVSSCKDPSRSQRVLLDEQTCTLTQLKRQLKWLDLDEVVLLHNGRVISDHSDGPSSEMDLRTILSENSVVFFTGDNDLNNVTGAAHCQSYGLQSNDVSHSLLTKRLFRKAEHEDSGETKLSSSMDNKRPHSASASALATTVPESSNMDSDSSSSSVVSGESLGSDTVQAMASRLNSDRHSKIHSISSSSMIDRYLSEYERYLRNFNDYRRRYNEMCIRHAKEAQSSMPSGLNAGWYAGYPYPVSHHYSIPHPFTSLSSSKIRHTGKPVVSNGHPTTGHATQPNPSSSHPTFIAQPTQDDRQVNADDNDRGAVIAGANAQNAAAPANLANADGDAGGLGVFAEAALLERAAAESERSQRSMARRFVMAITWLFDALKVSVIIRLSLFLYLFGQNVSETQWYSLTLFCIGYYIFKLGALQALYYFLVQRRVNQQRRQQPRPPVIGDDGEQVIPLNDQRDDGGAQAQAAGDVAAVANNAGVEPEVRNDEQREFDENGAEIERVRLLCFHELIHRYFCGLLASFYPEWHYSIWYPAPPLHTEVDPAIADRYGVNNNDDEILLQ